MYTRNGRPKESFRSAACEVVEVVRRRVIVVVYEVLRELPSIQL